MFALIEEAQSVDYQILAFMLRNSRVDINAGHRLPLCQAIERGHHGIVRLLLNEGNPHLCRLDTYGKAPIHYAGEKHDKVVLELL